MIDWWITNREEVEKTTTLRYKVSDHKIIRTQVKERACKKQEKVGDVKRGANWRCPRKMMKSMGW